MILVLCFSANCKPSPFRTKCLPRGWYGFEPASVDLVLTLSLATLQTVARLSALTRLCLTTWPEPLSAVPRTSELASLHSSSLQDLSISQNLVRWAGNWINEFMAVFNKIRSVSFWNIVGQG